MIERAIILYDDGDWSKGHYQSIFALYLKAFLDKGYRVSAACPDPDFIRAWVKIHYPEAANRCSCHFVEGRPLKARFRRLKPFTRMLWWMRAATIARQIHKKDSHAGSLFFMNINHLRGALWSDRFTDRLMTTPWAAFIFDSSLVRRGPIDINKLKQSFNFLSAKQCIAFGVTDEKMSEPMKQAFPNLSIGFLPDATPHALVSDAPLLNAIHQKAAGRKIAGLLGMLHKRKGLIPTLELAESCPETFFLFAGDIDLDKMTGDEKKYVTDIIQRNPDNCFFHLERIAEESEFNALIQALDVVIAIYPGFTNTSGLLTKAGLFNKPCLVAAGDTCMADRVAKYGLGAAVSPDDLPAARDALSQLLQQPADQFKSAAFHADFSEDALATSLNQLLTTSDR